jgi:hypothetical protein
MLTRLQTIPENDCTEKMVLLIPGHARLNCS